MRFLRALLNSGVFMIILLAAATLYLVYSDAVKRDHGLMDESASGQSLASQLPAEDSQPVPVKPVTTVQAEPESQAASAMAEPAVASPEASAAAAQAEASAVQAVTEPATSDAQLPPASDRDMPEFPPMMPAQAMPAMPAMPEPMMPPAMPAMPAYGTPSHALVPQQPASSMPDRQPQPELTVLETARMAFYQGDLTTAEQHYLQALAQSNDPDVQGELGNVYFAQQNLNKAVEHYAAAVDGLGKQGRFLQAQYVLGFVMQVSPEKGQQLLDGLRGQMYPQPPAPAATR